ncbi:hypothetical protein, partial [Klebsiella pneumoniae]|uniref:hypothetical protein n=1 Tax=Klebsiella pneumoniae TaxID=573 RepID=UPI003B97F0FC
FVAGDVAGSAASTAFVNPWEKNEDTGKNYTWGETASHALTTGLATGSVFAAARVPDMVGGTIYRGATNLLPGEGGTLSRFMGTNAIAAGER